MRPTPLCWVNVGETISTYINHLLHTKNIKNNTSSSDDDVSKSPPCSQHDDSSYNSDATSNFDDNERRKISKARTKTENQYNLKKQYPVGMLIHPVSPKGPIPACQYC